MNRNASAERMRPVVWGAAILFLCLSAASARGQRREAPRAAPPRFSASRSRPAQPHAQRRMGQQQGRFQPNQAARPESGYRPAAPGQYPNANFNGGYARPAYPGAGRANGYGGYAPPGHLQSWLNQHQGLPVQDQERLLRNDPSFNRLPPGQQQRLVQQLHQVDQMPEQQRERRLARNELLERLSPQERMGLNTASRQFATLPPDRQQIMKGAFRDLRSVPPDQRQTVLNSARFQGQFSPEERDILTNFLRVEPYEPPR
ncbi:MAG TPA: DUF3106 domain-containing protein [Terracidiphilus sp.]